MKRIETLLSMAEDLHTCTQSYNTMLEVDGSDNEGRKDTQEMICPQLMRSSMDINLSGAAFMGEKNGGLRRQRRL